MTWQPIETAPSEADVLLFSPDATVTAWIGHRFTGDAPDTWYPQEESPFGSSDVPPTHWMPLPEPPGGSHPAGGSVMASHLWQVLIRQTGGKLAGLEATLTFDAGDDAILLAMEARVPLPAGTRAGVSQTAPPQSSAELDRAVQALAEFARSHFALRTGSEG